jgi:hypothetical protein
METFFTKSQAAEKIGRRVRLTSAIGSVPIGAHREVVKAVRRGSDQWRVRINWSLLALQRDFQWLERNRIRGEFLSIFQGNSADSQGGCTAGRNCLNSLVEFVCLCRRRVDGKGQIWPDRAKSRCSTRQKE